MGWVLSKKHDVRGPRPEHARGSPYPHYPCPEGFGCSARGPQKAQVQKVISVITQRAYQQSFLMIIYSKALWWLLTYIAENGHTNIHTSMYKKCVFASLYYMI